MFMFLKGIPRRVVAVFRVYSLLRIRPVGPIVGRNYRMAEWLI